MGHNISTAITETKSHFKKVLNYLNEAFQIGCEEELTDIGLYILDLIYLEIFDCLLATEQNPLGKNARRLANRLPDTAKNNFFFLVHKFDQEKVFEEGIANKTIPTKWRMLYAKWKKSIDTAAIEKFDLDDDSSAPSLPEPEDTLIIEEPEPEPNHKAQEPEIIELEYPIVIGGEPDEGIATLKGEESDADKIKAHIRHRKRDLLLTVLEKAGISMDSVTIYKEKSTVAGPQTGRYPYQIIDIADDKLSAHVILCNWTGFSTYIIRDPEALNTQQPTVISDLRDMDNVWKVIHRDEDQWNREMHAKLFTSTLSMPIQLKHILAWKEQKEPLVSTFMTHIVATGSLPRTNDDKIISIGALKKKSTWQRAANALRNGSIEGLKNVKNFFQLYDYAVEQDPRIKNFKGREPIPKASEIFNRSVQFIRKTELAPQTAFYADITQFDRPAQLISDAFHFNAIQGWEVFVQNPSNAPQNLEEFISATGLATWNGDTLEVVDNYEQVVADICSRAQTDQAHHRHYKAV